MKGLLLLLLDGIGRFGLLEVSDEVILIEDLVGIWLEEVCLGGLWDY